MKKLLSLILALIIAISLFSLSACGKTSKGGVWQTASYAEDTELGEGEKSFILHVTADGGTVNFTVHTDKTTVGEALSELELIDGEQGDYGLFIKQVNGITADYDADGSYWMLYIDGEMAMSGIDLTDITEGAEYTLAKEK